MYNYQEYFAQLFEIIAEFSKSKDVQNAKKEITNLQLKQGHCIYKHYKGLLPSFKKKREAMLLLDITDEALKFVEHHE